MNLPRVAYLTIQEDSRWMSCSKIERAFRQLYQELLSHEMVIFSFSLSEPESWEKVAQELADFDPSLIILPDHRIRLDVWPKLLKRKLKKSCRWIIHTYGCILTRTDELTLCSEELVGERVSFITPSGAHESILQSFTLERASIVKIPFPILNEKTESPDQNYRNLLGLSKDTRIFLSVNRISMDKNVHHLIHLFREYWKTQQDSSLILCGTSDLESSLQFNLAAELFHLELEAAKKEGCPVYYLGNLATEDLRSLMKQSDLLISLSTNIGEDYGMACAEALSLNLPCLVTKWGGHREFASHPCVDFVQVYLENESLVIDEKNLLQQMSRTRNKSTAEIVFSDARKELEILLREEGAIFKGLSTTFYGYAKKLLFYEAYSPKPFSIEFKDYVYPYWK